VVSLLYNYWLLLRLIYTHYIHSVVVQDFVSGRVCCVNQYNYESRKRRVVMRLVHATDKSWYTVLYHHTINESRLSDTRCLIQDVVSPHCGDKRMARRCTRRSLPNYFDMTSYHWNVKMKIKDIPITYIVWWYKTLYQVESVVWTSITTSLESDEPEIFPLGASLETNRNLSLGCVRFFRLALLPVLHPLFFTPWIK
jgi:hypothetical protein